MLKARRVFIILCATLLAVSGCADKKMRVISSDIPLNIYDLEEIRSGVDAHKKYMEQVKFIQDETVNAYIRDIGRKLAKVCERPFLPWRVFVIDDKDEYDAFAHPGGHIYITSGLFSFVESEAELAAVIAHEVGHTSAYRYHNKETSKKIQFAKAIRMGAGAAGGFAGPAGDAVSSVLSGIEVSSPYLRQQFSKNAEAEADGRAMNYLTKLGYPPEAVVNYNRRLASTPIDTIPKFVHFFNAHPPSEFRVNKAAENLKGFSSKAQDGSEYYWGAEQHREMTLRLFPEKDSETKKSLIDIVLNRTGATSPTEESTPASVPEVRVP